MVLDGEIVALDGTGRPSFNALQNRAQLKTATGDRGRPARHAGGAGVLRPAALCRASICARRRTRTAGATWRSACCRPGTCSWCTSPRTREELYGAALDLGFEGIMAKRLRQPLPAGRALARVAEDQGVRVRGVRHRRLHPRQGRARYARSAAARLLRGQDAALRRPRGLGARRTGSISAAAQAYRQARTAPVTVRREARRCIARPPGSKPQLVAEVSFSEWTPAGALRAPVFLRLRDDIAAAERARRRSEPGRPRPDRAPRRARAPPAASRRRPRRGRGGRRAAEEPRQEPRAQRRRRAHQAHQPRPHLLAGRPAAAPAGDHQARLHRLPRAGRALHAAAPHRPPADHDPHARGHQRRALLPEALGTVAAGVRASR